MNKELHVAAETGGPSPDQSARNTHLHVTVAELREALEFMDSPSDDPEGETPLVLTRREAFTSTDGETMEAGLYVHLAEYPEEGVIGPLGTDPKQQIGEPMRVTDEMISRFLNWKLPVDFSPDAGITFKPDFNVGTPWPMKHEPSGTNLLNAQQARAMLEHILRSAGDAR